MSDKINVARIRALGHVLLYMNSTRPPFNDVRVRQAVDMALDRKKAIAVAEGRGELSALMPPGPWALPEEELLKRPGYRGVTTDDVEMAKALLAEAGYSDGFKAMAMAPLQYAKENVFMQDQLKAVGIQVAIETVDVATGEKRRMDGDFELHLTLQGEPINHPDLFLSRIVTGSSRNYGRFSDKLVDEWYQEQSTTLDLAKRKEIVMATQRRILDLAALPILQTNIVELAYWKCMKDFYPEKQFGYFGNLKKQDIWLDDGCR